MNQRLIDANKLSAKLHLKYGFGPSTESMQELICAAPTIKINGETSDGYHTFNELYHHRAVLFSVIIAMFKDRAWKSRQHHDGTMYDGMFIVGIDTPAGPATYHYDINPYWLMFDCKELDRAPEWDDHTPAQAIERIGTLQSIAASVVHARWVHPSPYPLGEGGDPYCSNCKKTAPWFPLNGYYEPDCCPHCGANMDLEEVEP